MTLGLADTQITGLGLKDDVALCCRIVEASLPRRLNDVPWNRHARATNVDGPPRRCYDPAIVTDTATKNVAREGWRGDVRAMVSDAMIVIRSVMFNVLFYVSFIALMVFGSPCLLVSRAATLHIVRAWARTSVWLLAAICDTKVEFRNLHLLPKGASIIAAKHQSFLETFALILVLDDFAYILKKELMVIPFFGWYLKGSDQIAIDRAKRGATMPALQRAVREKLAAGRQIVIFPEGTRRLISAPPLYKVGVSALVAASGAVCTPVALNSGLFWPRRSILRRPGTVVIEFLPPIPTGLDRQDFMERLQNAIEPATDALVADAMAKDPDLARIAADAAREAQRPGASADMPASHPKDHKSAAA